MEKMPPIEKIYKAYSAIADGRVMLGDGRAEVTSSDGSKTYTVSWNNSEYRSDDNATYWQGYPGYPIIAVLPCEEKTKGSIRKETEFIYSELAGLNITVRRGKTKKYTEEK